MSSAVTVHGTGLSGPSVTANVQMANNISFVMAKENFLNDNVTVEEARDSENVLVISGSRTAVTDQIEQWNGQGLVDGFDISGGGGGGGATVKNASVGVHEGNIPQDRDYRIVVSGEIKEVPAPGPGSTRRSPEPGGRWIAGRHRRLHNCSHRSGRHRRLPHWSKQLTRHGY